MVTCTKGCFFDPCRLPSRCNCELWCSHLHVEGSLSIRVSVLFARSAFGRFVLEIQVCDIRSKTHMWETLSCYIFLVSSLIRKELFPQGGYTREYINYITSQAGIARKCRDRVSCSDRSSFSIWKHALQRRVASRQMSSRPSFGVIGQGFCENVASPRLEPAI